MGELLLCRGGAKLRGIGVGRGKKMKEINSIELIGITYLFMMDTLVIQHLRMFISFLFIHLMSMHIIHVSLRQGNFIFRNLDWV